MYSQDDREGFELLGRAMENYRDIAKRLCESPLSRQDGKEVCNAAIQTMIVEDLKNNFQTAGMLMEKIKDSASSYFNQQGIPNMIKRFQTITNASLDLYSITLSDVKKRLQLEMGPGILTPSIDEEIKLLETVRTKYYKPPPEIAEG